MNIWFLEISNWYYKPEEVNIALSQGLAVRWKQLPPAIYAGIQPGDIAYVYNCEPIKRISWKCEITGVFDSGKKECTADVKALYRYPDSDPRFAYADINEAMKGSFSGFVRRQQLISSDLLAYLEEADAPYANTYTMANWSAVPVSPSADAKSTRPKPSKKAVPSKTVTIVQRSRNQGIADWVKRAANGKCELCQMDAPFSKDNVPYLESHHIVWLSMGGEDSPENVVALCPNCHRKMHVLNLPEDVETLRKIAKGRS